MVPLPRYATADFAQIAEQKIIFFIGIAVQPEICQRSTPGGTLRLTVGHDAGSRKPPQLLSSGIIGYLFHITAKPGKPALTQHWLHRVVEI